MDVPGLTPHEGTVGRPRARPLVHRRVRSRRSGGPPAPTGQGLTELTLPVRICLASGIRLTSSGAGPGRGNHMAIADETLDRIEVEDLSGLGRADIDDVIEYVHVPTARLPDYRKLYDRYLRQRWNVNDLDFTEDRVNWTERMTDDSRNSFLSIASGFHHGERQVEVE